ncbi:unnamed protein product [Rotaria socialis]|uniref:Uncharacterized protein n=3 Tax=Rotaria socialis TaxID=392032 RepID=A0A817YQL6_9BILA|nr:unnamed protein product [Rotaria socialis]CAF3432672.1 unnamed protein product [Rotaria socialis]CAF3551521.1 unnamed protein product [Rotaria socialis]CAF3677835.1 unnamed protein product [Rotaria socialis]CAF4087155.1 unnamed protein product [Rotaria socialis]
MFLKLLFIGILTLPPNVHSLCYSNLSQTWICDSYYALNTTTARRIDYQSVLLYEKFENLFVKNDHWSIFIIDQYPSTLQLLNASNNKIQTIIITPQNRYRSNLRQLILESNNIRQFNSDTIILPQSLEIISLANNLLEVLDARIFSDLKKLIKLDLKNNQLKRVLPELLLNIKIDLNNNPLNCQCTTEFYRRICEKSTNLKQSASENNNCMAPYYDPQKVDSHPASYLRFSKFTLTCPIGAQPPPMIIWSTPFGNLTSINSSSIDLILFNNDQPFYRKLKTFAGPFSARTRHIFYAFNTNQLSVTQARASLQHYLSCSGINMLGVYTHTFDFDIDTYAEKHALWIIAFTMSFGLFMSLIGGLICIILKRTYYYRSDHLKTPPVYPTMAPNSAERTPPNFELNQWLSSAAANITETLEQVRDKLRLGVQQAGGTIRQAAETSAAYLQSIRVQTLSSLRNSGHFMRVGMNMLTTQVNSLRDYCGMTTGNLIPTNYLLQQQQFHNLQQSNSSVLYIHNNQMPIINEGRESMIELESLMPFQYRSPYAGYIASTVLANESGIGQLDTAANSALTTLNNFNQDTVTIVYDENLRMQGHMIGGIGTFHNRRLDELINESKI